jgi:hypothetical protein
LSAAPAEYSNDGKYEYSLSPDAVTYRPQADSQPLTIDARFVGCPPDACTDAVLTPTGFVSR